MPQKSQLEPPPTDKLFKRTDKMEIKLFSFAWSFNLFFKASIRSFMKSQKGKT